MTEHSVETLKAKVEEASEFLRLLGSPSRLLLLCHLARGEASVAEIERDLGLQQPALSQQLAELRRNRLVTTRRQSRSIYYSLTDDRTKAVLGMLYEVFCGDPQKLVREKPLASLGKPARGDVATFAVVQARGGLTPTPMTRRPD